MKKGYFQYTDPYTANVHMDICPMIRGVGGSGGPCTSNTTERVKSLLPVHYFLEAYEEDQRSDKA